jgi:hypothetical protein
VRDRHRYALPRILLGLQPHGLALVVEYSVEPAVLGGFPKKFFLFFCFSFFTIATPARPRPSRIRQSSRRFVIRLALAARASLAALRTPTLAVLGTVRAFISRVSRPVPVGPSYKRSSLQHLRSLPMSAGYPIPHSS